MPCKVTAERLTNFCFDAPGGRQLGNSSRGHDGFGDLAARRFATSLCAALPTAHLKKQFLGCTVTHRRFAYPDAKPSLLAFVAGVQTKGTKTRTTDERRGLVSIAPWWRAAGVVLRILLAWFCTGGRTRSSTIYFVVPVSGSGRLKPSSVAREQAVFPGVAACC